jgi:hypothetical protein
MSKLLFSDREQMHQLSGGAPPTIIGVCGLISPFRRGAHRYEQTDHCHRP